MREQYKKSTIGWFAFTLALMVLVSALAAGLFYMQKSNARFKNEAENRYQQSLYELNSSLGNIETNMSKLLVCGEGSETAILLNDTYRQCQIALCGLSDLPLSAEDSAAAGKLINQAGDFCSSHCKRILDGIDDAVYAVTESGASSKDSKQGDYDEQLELLYPRVKMLSESVKKATNRLDGKYKLLSHIDRGVLNDFDLSVQKPRYNADNTGENNDNTVKNSTEYPELIYDGPFSDANNTKEFKGLKGLEILDQGQAEEKAKTALESTGLRKLELLGEAQSPDAYCFKGLINGGEMYLTVAKNGGVILNALTVLNESQASIESRALNQDEAKKKALEFAKMCGFEKELSPVWYNEIDGYALINLAPTANGIVCYPDLIKVKLSLVSGEFLGLEASGFCACNHERKLTPLLSKDDAQANVSKKLDVYSSRLCVIPKDTKEVLAWEFAAKYKDFDFFVYIDAQTGRVCNVMRVVDSDQGQMVM